MQENQDKITYVTIPGKGDFDIDNLLDTINYLRQLVWINKVWTPAPALIDKSGGSSRKYVGQKFDPKYIDLVQDGWTHDHCEICTETLSNKESYGEMDGYKTDNGDWICKQCYKLFIIPNNIEDTIQLLKK